MSFGINGLDDEEQLRLQYFLNENGGALSGLLGDTGEGAGSAAPLMLPEGIQQGIQEGGFQAQPTEAPVAPVAPATEAADGISGVTQPSTGGSDVAKEMAQVGQQSLQPNNGLLERQRQLNENAINELNSRKGGGLLGSLLKIGINTALGNWLGGVGSKAFGTVGDAFNKAFKIKGIGAK